ncbi:hypothetical protein E2C01_063856 [Portunus trituberculatus]|uniref:Uncharacterized protein n=1 Tax=Portunus trituberculatus TaxID=210409 RepID=A0A5B7HI78_PORTR|nr:hypothetical protein [Portunus trituberculatus]
MRVSTITIRVSKITKRFHVSTITKRFHVSTITKRFHDSDTSFHDNDASVLDKDTIFHDNDASFHDNGVISVSTITTRFYDNVAGVVIALRHFGELICTGTRSNPSSPRVLPSSPVGVREVTMQPCRASHGSHEQ